jgi:hypothetical protein
MKKWLTSVFLLLALASGVLAGTPLHSGKMSSEMMDCCDKAKSLEQSPQAEMARLCCALNCSDSSPVSSSTSPNFSPSNITVRDAIITQIAQLLAAQAKPVFYPAFSLERARLPRKIPPKYIQNHSILI